MATQPVWCTSSQRHMVFSAVRPDSWITIAPQHTANALLQVTDPKYTVRNYQKARGEYVAHNAQGRLGIYFQTDPSGGLSVTGFISQLRSNKPGIWCFRQWALVSQRKSHKKIFLNNALIASGWSCFRINISLGLSDPMSIWIDIHINTHTHTDTLLYVCIIRQPRLILITLSPQVLAHNAHIIQIWSTWEQWARPCQSGCVMQVEVGEGYWSLTHADAFRTHTRAHTCAQMHSHKHTHAKNNVT